MRLLSPKHLLLVSSSHLKTTQWGIKLETISARIIHGATDDSKKFKEYYVSDIINKYLKYSRKNPAADLVVWPESSVAQNYLLYEDRLKKSAKKLKKRNASLILGTYTEEGTGDRTQFYDTLLVADNPESQYKKHHLIPFGEYIPSWSFIDLDKHLPKIDMGELNQGLPNQHLLIIGNVKVAASICYEIIFSNELRKSWKTANILVNASDLNWFKGTWGPKQLLQIAQMRTLESGKPLLSSTNHGVSAIISSKGKIIKKIEGKSGYIDGKITPVNGYTPYTTYGSMPLIWFCFAVLFLIILVVFRDKALIKSHFKKKKTTP